MGLAKLKLSDGEVTTFTAQLQGILNYIDQLSRVDVQGVGSMTHPFDEPTPFREDVVCPSPVDTEGRPKTLLSAPDVLDGGYKVPSIL